MENSQTLKLAGLYVGLWFASTVAGLVLAGAGVAVGALLLVGLRGFALITPPLYPRAGTLLVVLGVLVWQFGSAAALLKTVSLVVELETAGQLDTEAMKSDILSVLDDRLADMHQELDQTRRLLDRFSRDDAASEFEFEDFEGD